MSPVSVMILIMEKQYVGVHVKNDLYLFIQDYV